MADLDHAAAPLDPSDRAGHCDRHLGHAGPDRRREWVHREMMEDIGEEEFLMLLLMMTAERDEVLHIRGQIGQSRQQRRIHSLAISEDLVERGTRQHPPTRPRVALPLGLVIAVEQERPAFVEQLIAGHMIAQHERLEEPGCVGEMPFGGRRIVHRLDRRIGIRKRCDKIGAERPNRGETRCECGGSRVYIALRSHNVPPTSGAP